MPLKTIGPGITSQDHNDNNAYLEGLMFGKDDKLSVRAATTANIVLSGTQTVDGVVLVAGDRVLAKNQTTGSQNGLYVVAAGVWARATDADASGELTSGMMVRVNEGTTNVGSEWYLTTPDPIVLGTTALTFTQADGLFTIVDTTIATASPGRIATLLSMLGNMIKQITGESTWATSPKTTILNIFNNFAQKAPASAPWIVPTLLNSWINSGSGASTAAYYKDDFGIVHLKGIIKSGTTTDGTILFTLPAGYRPLELMQFAASTGSTSATPAWLDVLTTGSVRFRGGLNTAFGMDGINFRAEQ